MHISHLAIWVANLENVLAFYQTYFGAQPSAKYVNEQKQFESYFLHFSAGPRLELMHQRNFPSANPPIAEMHLGYAHIAISVGSETEVDRLTLQLKHDGFQCLSGPRWTGDGYYESVILDPEGNHVEITI